jgi:hypothetical protein
MPSVQKQAMSLAIIGIGCLLLGACKQPRDAPPTVEDLMQDRVALDGILMKCTQASDKNRPGPDCEIARVAVERLGAAKEAAETAQRQQDFERNREKLRSTDDQRKAAQAEQKKVDVYTMPVVPVEPPATAPAPAPASTADHP